MLALILAVAIGQYPESKGDLARHDLCFALAVEESIARESATEIPEPYRSMIGLLGVPAWKERENSSSKLLAAFMADPLAARWLFWGRKSPDPEIASRCNGVLRRLYRCGSCHGTGNSGATSNYQCWDCSGAGTAWPFSWLD